jgi:hypothetical protein
MDTNTASALMFGLFVLWMVAPHICDAAVRIFRKEEKEDKKKDDTFSSANGGSGD